MTWGYSWEVGWATTGLPVAVWDVVGKWGEEQARRWRPAMQKQQQQRGQGWARRCRREKRQSGSATETEGCVLAGGVAETAPAFVWYVTSATCDMLF